MKAMPQQDCCDVCKGPLTKGKYFYDAKTKKGPWAWLCEACFTMFGVGLGIGRGQRYSSKTKEKVNG